MPGKRLRLVRSKASFDDLSALSQPMQPPPQMRMSMKPSRPQFPPTAPTEEDDFVLYQPQTLTLRPDVKKVNDQGHIGNFLDRCNYCRKVLGEKDNIYMYSSLRAFCSSQCRQRQIIMDNVGERVASGQSTTSEIMSWLRKMNSLVR